MLDIIVTHYKEPWEVGKPLFDMLALQRGVDFGIFRVLVVNDGEEHHLPDDLFSGYPYRVTQVDIPHGGVSAARNAGIDCSDAEWINFCDFDDTYSNVYALRDVMNVMPAPNYNILWVQLMAEDFTNGKDDLLMMPEKSNFVFLHGKYYRRSWLVQSGLRFDTSFRFQEDSLFNAIAIAMLDYHRIGKIRTLIPPFIWCRRTGSVTMSDKNEDDATMAHFLRNCKVCEYYREHLSEERTGGMVVRSVYDAYLMVNSKNNVTDNFRDELINKFAEFIREYDSYYSRPDEDTLRQIEFISRYELQGREVRCDFETVTRWKEMMMRKVA